MNILVARHGLSTANDRKNAGTMAFANTNATLLDLGKEQAIELGVILTEMSFEREEPVAVSELLRTQATARSAGFYALQIYPLLNEVIHGLPYKELRELLDNNELPKSAIVQAETILERPPTERIWISHGLVIAGLCRVLGIHQKERLIPRFCEIRELDLG